MRSRKVIGWWAGLALVLIWTMAIGAMRLARASRMTAEKVVALMQAEPLEGKPPEERLRRLDRLADRINRLPFEERQRLRMKGDLRAYFEELPVEERRHFIERTMPSGLRQMTEAFNRMSREERRRLVERALEDLRRESARARQDAERAWREDPELTQRLVDEGMKVYLTETSAEAKIDLQPLIEQMQAILRGPMR